MDGHEAEGVGTIVAEGDDVGEDGEDEASVVILFGEVAAYAGVHESEAEEVDYGKEG